MKLNKKKKGFTIVELVIVIAVVAILSAILIPTFVNLVYKANVSADQSLVKNLNTSLAMEVEDGAKPTMYDTLKVMEEKYGYIVTKLSPTAASNDIVWDSEKNQFVLVMNKEGKYFTGTSYEKYTEADYYKLWKIYNTMPADANQTYSIYLSSKVTGSVTTNGVGLDVGDNENVDVNYIDTVDNIGRTITIRTNGGTLTVDAEKDTINHYGNLKEGLIKNVDQNNCYREYGSVSGKLNITKGKVVLESGSNVTFINIAENAEVETLKVEIKNGAEYGRVTASSSEKLAQFSDKVTSETNTIKTLVASSNTVAIVDNVAYESIDEALNAFTEEAGVFELFTNISNENYNSTSVKLIQLPKNGELNGHNYEFSGNVKVDVSNGGKVHNVNFKNIHNNSTRTSAQVNKYGITLSGTLSCIYSSNLNGTVEIYDCNFDNADWDMIQITPNADAVINIHDNVFKTTNPESYGQIRWIHIQSSKNTDFSVTIKNNDFYNAENLLSSEGQAVEVYYPTDASKLIISGNYFDNIDKNSIVNGNYNNNYACIGVGGNSYCNANTMLLNELRENPNK